jgi:phosphoribosylaminoimidazolecarboxamide formyltransferase / IMP cyclohydrolase
VSDKTGLLAFARSLHALHVEIISTGGTAEALKKDGIPVTPIDAVTGFPEILSGRVKTLHPKVHGGLLGVRTDPAHAEQMRQHAIEPIDLVCVNLYPFEQTIAKPQCSREDAIENIDIGGPSMIRSAAKNHAFVTVVTSPAQFARVEQELAQHQGATTLTLREQFAADAFSLTARYDAAIADYMAGTRDARFPAILNLSLLRQDELRYGENPHQAAALYRIRHTGSSTARASLATAEQLHGKELSYNNINDAAAALELAIALAHVDRAQPGACVIKHTNPCGAAIASTVASAIDLAIAGDPLAAYGGILAVNHPIDLAGAQRIAHKDCFFEVILAPSLDRDALALLQARWTNVRLLSVGSLDATIDVRQRDDTEFRSIPGGVLVQQRDTALTPSDQFTHRAGPAPTKDQLRIASFLEAIGRCLFSNAVVLGGATADGIRMFGGGAGQMDRLTSCKLAVEKAGPHASGAIAYSDAFFPFSDGPSVLIDAGVRAIIHPGGSKRDDDTFALCNQHQVTCLTTGVRHFRH